MSRSPAGCPRASDPFDVNAFRRTMHHRGGAYRIRGMELIKISRTFSAASAQDFRQDDDLQKVLDKCDQAIARAVDLGKKETTEESDQLFEFAIRALHDYCLDHHHDISRTRRTVDDPMEDANKTDMKNKHKFWNRTRDDASTVVCFHILRSLPDENHICVRQALSGTAKLHEILWNFSHYEEQGKRLILAQNPHFYRKLPRSASEYGDKFKGQPTEHYEETIYVLTGSSRRVFFEFGEKRRAFDNVLATNDVLVFKDVVGRLEGEAVIEESVQHSPLFFSRINPPEFQHEAVEQLRDWNALTRKLRDCQDTHIRFSDNKP